MTPIVSYLRNGTLPEDHNALRRLKVQLSHSVLIGDVFYKIGFYRPYLRSLVPNEVDYVIREVHEGVCGNHLGVRLLVHKLIRVGYCWPIMQIDTQSNVKECDKFQRFNNIIRQPSEQFIPMNAPWPITQWGLDIMGPFPMAIQQLKFLVLGIDYFTKWVKVEPLATIIEKNVGNFIWKRIICRLGIPESSSLIMGNNLTTTRSGTSTNIWESKTTIHRPPTHRPMVKSGSQTNPCLR